jgi:hypothetical protein
MLAEMFGEIDFVAVRNFPYRNKLLEDKAFEMVDLSASAFLASFPGRANMRFPIVRVGFSKRFRKTLKVNLHVNRKMRAA